jgi:hypothetical protein
MPKASTCQSKVAGTPNGWSVKVSKRKPLPRGNDIRRFGLICIAHRRRNADAEH